MNVGRTILQQLGGNKFIVMTGVKNLMSDTNMLSMRVPTKMCKNRITHVCVYYNPARDLYRVEAIKQKGAPTFEVLRVEVRDDVHVEQLCDTFEELTGLAVSL